ncbi:aspartate aminotransferase [Caminicella sporogenes DSM 14501]|uniref:Aminotransferase n=1 Tax=Caminicella sporogenes DSM 14501 TaxID=1121266 RepID=A0A1M6TW57_9FIRM|nr:pyridoxal phosphate-dependent aminotransferase [Caminicella sporogenes]RKD23513.1 aspartate aminotransferase [Caminicella sporogenes]WIF95985.1 pyridoxal phosphate-dependent aminotransferase [Caminicella sporogenes]SHK61171.1 aspartate aminotransferase [Caminicella sporogenes DSM 14501]
MLSKKISNITPSYTIGISTKITELKKQGIDIINLSIGEPDFFTPKKAKEEGIKAIHDNKTKYDAASGLKNLKKVIQEKLEMENNISYDLDEIVISSGAKHAITNTLIAFLDPGDEVIIPKPYWVSYSEMVKLLDGVPIFVDTDRQNDFKITASDLEKTISPKTKLLFITNPSNPTGAVYQKKELMSIVDICYENNVHIIADEIYEKICYTNNFVSIASLSEKAKEITITINGLSKSAAMTGWRIGYSACKKEIATAIATIQGHLVSHPSTISQWAAYGALTLCKNEMEEMVKIYKNRRDKVILELSKVSNLSFIKPQGAFYIFIDISKLKNKIQYKNSFSIEFSNKLLDKYKVAVVPGIAFGMDDYIRISYACNINDVIEGINRLNKFIEDLNS